MDSCVRLFARIKQLTRKVFTTSLIFLSVASISSAAGKRVDDDVIVAERKFVERVAAAGYYELARIAMRDAQKIPGLFEKQKSYLSLIQATIDIAEIKQEKDLGKRKARLGKTIAFLKKLVIDLPEGSQLKLQARARLFTAGIDVADVYVKEIQELDFEIMADPKGTNNQALGRRRKKLIAMAESLYDFVRKGAVPLRKDMIKLFDLLAEKWQEAGIDDRLGLKAKYYRKMESVFVDRVDFEHRVAGMYPNQALLYPRTSNKRTQTFENGYWWNADIEELHSQYMPGDRREAVIYIRLAGLIDQPLSGDMGSKSKGFAAVTARVPSPITLLTKTFKDKIIGSSPKKTDKSEAVQFSRAEGLFYFAKAWLEMTKGAYEKSRAAKDAKIKSAWEEHGQKMHNNFNRAVKELYKDISIVGKIPSEVKRRIELELKISMYLFLAGEARDKKDKEEFEKWIMSAKEVCGRLLISFDEDLIEPARRMTGIINVFAPHLANRQTVGELLAAADLLAERYNDAKDRKEPQAKQEEILVDMQDRYIKALRALAKAKNMDRSMQTDFTVRCWYQIGLGSLYLKEYYTAYIANQHLLQVFNSRKYPAADYAEVDNYRKYASANVVAAASRQRKATRDLFDGNLYAESLIWRITYQSAVDPAKIREFYYEIGNQYEKNRMYLQSYEWLIKTPDDSKYYRLSYLKRGLSAYKYAEQMLRESRRAEQQAANSAGSRAREKRELAEEKKALNKKWLQTSEKDIRKFIRLIAEFSKKYGKNIPEHLAGAHKDELKNRYSAYQLLMIIKNNQKDFKAVRDLAAEFAKYPLPAENKKSALTETGWLTLIACVKAVNPEIARPEKVASWLEKAGPYAKQVRNNAKENDKRIISAMLLLGGSWLNLAKRVEADNKLYVLYRQKAGGYYKNVKDGIYQNINTAILVGSVFTDEKMYKDAEEVYDLTLKFWDNPKKYPAKPEKKDFADKIKDVSVVVGAATKPRHGTELAKKYQAVIKYVYGAKPNFYQARAKIGEILAYIAKIKNNMLQKAPHKKELLNIFKALEFESHILKCKRNLVRAKVALGKWDEALALLTALLEHYKNSPEFTILKGDVHFERALLAWKNGKSKEEIMKDLQVSLEVGKKFIVMKKTKLRQFGDRWWQAIGLYYQAKALEIVAHKDEQKYKAQAPKRMKYIKIYQSYKGDKKASKEYMRRSEIAFNLLLEAGFKKLERSKKDRKKDIERAGKLAARMRKQLENNYTKDFLARKRRLIYLLGTTPTAASKAKSAGKAGQLMFEIDRATREEDSSAGFNKSMQVYLRELGKFGFKIIIPPDEK